LLQVRDASSAVVESFDYGKTGDRTSKTFGGSTQAYAYVAGSHRLQSVAGVNRNYDANGNTTQIGAAAFVYDARNRLRQMGSTSYDYNGLGARVAKTVAGATTIFTYSLNDQLLTDSLSPFKVPTEYIWIDDVPVGVVKNGRVYYVEADQLGT